MPKIDKVFTLTVTPEKFLNACSTSELHEVELLLFSPRFRKKMAVKKPNLKNLKKADNEKN